MKDTPAASFRFKNYIITNFEFNAPDETTEEDINIGISVSGVFNKIDNRYILNMNFFAAADSENKNKFITATLNGLFEFREKVDTPPDYFYANSIAIVFPYLRAYISVVTNMANNSQLVIPTLNLTSLRQELIDNTKIIEIEPTADNQKESEIS